MITPWIHQTVGTEAGYAAERAGKRSICITSPTGGGKRTMIVMMASRTVEEGKTAVIYTNRRMITHQTKREIEKHGMAFDMVASGYPAKLAEQVRICSLQTVQRRRGSTHLPSGERIFIDEGHGKAFHWLIPYYLEKGSTVYLFTATPVGLQGVCDHLVIAGKNSELRSLGALVPCHCYSPDQPSIKGVRKLKIGETFDQAFQRYFTTWQTEIFANLFSEWKRQNPFTRPTLVFAPGVAESRWVADEFNRLGISAAHLDGETSDTERDEIEGGSRDGRLKVVSSCGVMREGADWGWIYYGIGLQAWVELSTYLQCAGRLLRSWPGKEECILQDHSGAYWRHGSPNEDREWELGCTDLNMAKKRFEAYRNGETPEPIRCPKCNGERKAGPKCPHCGHEHNRSVRMIRMNNGTLKKMQGNLTKKQKKIGERQKLWNGLVYSCAYSGRTLRQCKGLFKSKLGVWPDASMDLKPWSNDDQDDNRYVRDVWPWLVRKRKSA